MTSHHMTSHITTVSHASSLLIKIKNKKIKIKSRKIGKRKRLVSKCTIIIWIINSLASLCKVIVSTIGINIACLESQLTMTRIMSHLDKKRGFSIKSIEIEFHSC